MFLQICATINFPVSLEKTFRASSCMVFLGMLVNTVEMTVLPPVEKVRKAMDLIENMANKCKVTVKQIQKLCGFLNFLCRSIVPSRAFTRCLYAYTGQNKLKSHHHIRVMQEIRNDLHTWSTFLQHPVAYCRPFIDFTRYWTAEQIQMYSDASKNSTLGWGAFCENSWTYAMWNLDFIINKDPSIEYLELFTVLVAVTNWIDRFRNKRIVLFCDNQSVVAMINNTTSSCRNCMVLIRKLVLHSMIHNVRVFACYITSKNNIFADLLSRNKFSGFWT